MFKCLNKLLFIEVPELDRVIKRARDQMMVQHIYAKSSDFFTMLFSLVYLKLSSINSTLKIELLYHSVLVTKNSKISTLTHSHRCYLSIFKALILLHIDFGDTVIGITPHVRLH